MKTAVPGTTPVAAELHGGEDEGGRPAAGNGRHRALDLKTRRAAPVNSTPAVGHPADAGPCPAQTPRTPPHKAPSIPVNVLPFSSSPPHRFPPKNIIRLLQIAPKAHIRLHLYLLSRIISLLNFQQLLPKIFPSLYSDINMKLKLAVKYSKIIGTITGRIQFTG